MIGQDSLESAGRKLYGQLGVLSGVGDAVRKTEHSWVQDPRRLSTLPRSSAQCAGQVQPDVGMLHLLRPGIPSIQAAAETPWQRALG